MQLQTEGLWNKRNVTDTGEGRKKWWICKKCSKKCYILFHAHDTCVSIWSSNSVEHKHVADNGQRTYGLNQVIKQQIDILYKAGHKTASRLLSILRGKKDPFLPKKSSVILSLKMFGFCGCASVSMLLSLINMTLICPIQNTSPVYVWRRGLAQRPRSTTTSKTRLKLVLILCVVLFYHIAPFPMYSLLLLATSARQTRVLLQRLCNMDQPQQHDSRQRA